MLSLPREDTSSAPLMVDAMALQALTGGGLPHEAERLLALAGANYHLDDVAEHHLREARALAPDHAAVLIGLYRFYFYKSRLNDALLIAELCLEKATHDNDLNADWVTISPRDADFASYEASGPRFFLFTLKAWAYLKMRLGCVEEGVRAIDKLLQLDPTDKIGARVLRDVVDRMGVDHDE